MDIKVFRPPTGQEQMYRKVEKARDDNPQQKKKDEGQQKKKKNDKMESIFSSLAEHLAFDDEGY